jgi:chromosomal replication initiator protein
MLHTEDSCPSSTMPHSDQLNTLWNLVCQHLHVSVSEDAYLRWFSSVKLLHAGEDTVRLRVPDSIHQLWIEMNYVPVLQAAFGAVTGVTHGIKIEVAAEPAAVQTVVVQSCAEETETVISMRSEEPELEEPNGLSHAMTFDNFVVGSSNSFAHAAASAVSEKPGRAYNPLFIYGGPGLGKTHLMQAVGAKVRERKPKARVVYTTCEDFINQYVNAIQTNSLTKFRKRFRQADVLLIDDVQFLSGKLKSQEEFFHTFNALLDAHKQIVISADCPPGDIRDIESRIISRLEWGHTTELMMPDEAMRVAILRQRAESLQVEVPAHVLEFIAARITSSIRRLQGALVRVASWISLHGPVPQQTLEELLRDLLAQEAKNVMTIERIQKGVADSFDIRLGDMVSRRRPNAIVLPRQIAMYLSRELTCLSYQDLGSAFGGRDHGTVMHACRAIERKMKEDENLRIRVGAIATQLRRSV